MLKRYLAVCLTLVLVTALMLPISALDTTEEPVLFDANEPTEYFDDEISEEEIDRKAYCTMTLDDDFDDRTVLVTFNKQGSLKQDVFTPDDFPEIDCAEVKDLTAGLKALMDRQHLIMEEMGTDAQKLKQQARTDEQWETRKQELPNELLDCDRAGLWLITPENL